MPELNDCRFDALIALGHTGATNEMLLAWAQAGGATSNNLNDALLEYLLLNNATSNNLNDAWVESLSFAGYTGTRNDMELDFWCNGGGVFDDGVVSFVQGWSHGDNCDGTDTITVIEYSDAITWDLDADLIAELTVADTTTPTHVPAILAVSGKGTRKLIITHVAWNGNVVAGDSINVDYFNVSSNLRDVFGNVLPNGTPTLINCLD
jgi:hypothetical protein